jgi:hypothetical protein
MMTKSTKGTMIRKLLTAALLAATVVGAAAPALAIDEDHAALLNAVHARGVTLYNDGDFCQQDKDVDGFYHGPSKALVICSEGTWLDLSENQLDTIRHETAHFIQDCADGNINGSLDLILKPGAAVSMLNRTNLDPMGIIRTYTQKGRAAHIPVELEAFGIARGHDAKTIKQALELFCPLP